MTPAEALASGLIELGVGLPEGASEQLLRYLTLLVKWNRTYNLTAIQDPLQMVSTHLLDSLAIVRHLPMPADAPALADAGSGAGLPGMALAIARPAWRVTLNDSRQKRTAFMRQAAIELGLRNVEVHEGRVEQWRPATRFPVVVSRAFARLGEFIAACRHLLAPGGVLAAMKGRLATGELRDVPLDCDCSSIVKLAVPGIAGERHLILCRPGV